jgi:excisionase family DNA binding protein
MARERMMNPREAAQQLGVGMARIYALLWSGKLAATKQGNRWLISARTIEARLKAREQAQ